MCEDHKVSGQGQPLMNLCEDASLSVDIEIFVDIDGRVAFWNDREYGCRWKRAVVEAEAKFNPTG